MSSAASRHAGFVTLLIFFSGLAGASVGFAGGTSSLRAAAVTLAVIAVAAGVAVLARGMRALLPLVVVSAAAVAAVFVWHLSHREPPLSFRGLHVATVVTAGAMALAAALLLLRVTTEPRAILVAGAIALPLIGFEMFVEPPVLPGFRTRWQVNTIPDPDVHFRYAPNSVAQNFYPDNPRGYFEKSDPVATTWSVETHAGSVATLTQDVTAFGRVLHVAIAKLVPGNGWHVKLQQLPYRIEAQHRYVTRFRARAATARPVACAMGHNHEPWGLLGTYHEFEVGTEWRQFECPFIGSGSDTNARLFFDLGKSDAAVDIADVVVRDETAGTIAAPATQAQEYLVTYRFNSMGFRGPDYAIPAPPGTYRILALGDSYTLGVGVHENDTFSKQLEHRLNKAGTGGASARRFEVINAGVSGYSTREERRQYEVFGSKYAPQLVLINMVYNDDMSFADEVNAGLVAAPGPQLSNLLARVDMARRSRRSYDYSGAVRELLDLNAAVNERGARLAAVIFRNSDSYEPWEHLVEAVRNGVAGTDVPVLDLGPTLLRGLKSEKEIWVHAVDGHPNEVAHRLAAGEIETFLRANRLLPD